MVAIEVAPIGSRSLQTDSQILTQGRRTALPRHQTLRATIDWSHQLLPATERRVFRRLAAFRGPFTLAGARAVASCKCVSAAEVDECVGNLVAKSLLAVDQQSAPPRYRLLAITRAYAEEKLAEDGKADVAARQHAAYARSVFEQAHAEWESRSTKAWLSDYVGQLPDLHAALEWAFAGTGDAQTGIALTVAAVPLWLELSQVDECLVWVQRALTVVEAAPDAYRRERMQLHAALGFPRMRAVWGRPGGAEAWRVTLSLAEELGDLDYQQRALWALWVAEMNRGEPTASLELADRFCRLETDTDVVVEQRIGARLRARSLHLLGRQDEARLEIDSMLGRYVAPGHRSHVARFQYDQRMVARANLGRIMWVQGHPEQAMQQMEDIVAEASASGHVLTLTHVLSDGACPVALLAGDLAAAERFTTMLEHNTQAHALDVWHAYAGCYRGELQIRGGDPKAGIARLRDALVTLQDSSFVLFRTAFLFALAQGLAAMDRITEGLAVVDDALDQCRRTREAWCVPELMRVRARLLLRQGDRHAAESWLRLSLQQAGQQNALSWALRTAVDLSRLRQDQGAVVDAIAVLAPIQARLSEGFGLPDGAAASALLAELRGLTSECGNTSQHNFAPIHSR
jgi:predicted ATPase